MLVTSSTHRNGQVFLRKFRPEFIIRTATLAEYNFQICAGGACNDSISMLETSYTDRQHEISSPHKIQRAEKMHTHLTYNSMRRLIVLLSLLRLHSSQCNNDIPALNMLTLRRQTRRLGSSSLLPISSDKICFHRAKLILNAAGDLGIVAYSASLSCAGRALNWSQTFI